MSPSLFIVQLSKEALWGYSWVFIRSDSNARISDSYSPRMGFLPHTSVSKS